MYSVNIFVVIISFFLATAAFGKDDATVLHDRSVELYEAALAQAEACKDKCLFEKVKVELLGNMHEAIRVNLPDRVAYLLSKERGAGQEVWSCYPKNYVEVAPKNDCYKLN